MDIRDKKNIILMPEYTIGGAEVQLRYIIERIEREKIETDVIILHQFGKKDDKYLHYAMSEMRFIHFVEMEMQGESVIQMKWKIYDYIKATSDTGEYGFFLVFHFWLTPMIPLFSEMGFYTIYSEREDASAIINNQKYLKSITKCDCLVSNTIFAQKQIEAATNCVVRVIRNGKKYISANIKRENRKVINILIPCNVDKRKNIETIIRFAAEYQEEDYRIRVVGEKRDRNYYNELNSLIRKMKIGSKISFDDYSYDMIKEYDWADIIILPSLSEGTPNVVLEAFMYEKPVIVSDIKTERELVTDENLRFAPKDIKGIRRAITYLENMSKQEYDSMIQSHHDIVKSEYGLERMTDEWVSVFESAMSNRYDDFHDRLILREDIYDLSKEYIKFKGFYGILCDWIWILQSGFTLADYFNKRKYKSIVIYGYRELGKLLFQGIPKDIYNIRIVDMNHEGIWEDADVLSPFEYDWSSCDLVIVTAISAYDTIKKQISGCCDCEIISLKSVIEDIAREA